MAKKKKSMASILRGIKRKALKLPRTQKQKQAYIEGMAKRMDKNPTAPEKSFTEILEELGILYETQKIVGGKIYDFFIPSKNILIEVDGDYWHAKDKELKDMSLMQKKTFYNDIKKNAIAKNNGFDIERVWEKDLKENYELTKFRFKYLLMD
jgi:very-short-patch-repair endonuclease